MMSGTTAKQGRSAALPANGNSEDSTPVENGQVRDPTEQHLPMLPKESGVALMGFGMIGVLLMDPFDIFLVLAGALVFTPQLFQRTEHWVQARFPKVHREGRRHINRFIDDFERRYPPE